MLTELGYFIVVAESGSLTQAAERLSMSLATLSRKLDRLERHLGCKLLHRSPQGAVLTRQGEAYFASCAEQVGSLQRKLEDLHQAMHSLSGPLKVLAPGHFGLSALEVFWPEFVQKYPQIDLSIYVSNEVVDIHQTQADMAIRIGPLPDSNLIQRRIGWIPTVLVSGNDGPNLLRVEELASVPSVASSVLSRWEMTHREGESHTVRKQHKYIVNDPGLALNMVKTGHVVSLLPWNIALPAIESGEVRHLFPEWNGPERHVSLLWPYRQTPSARMQAFTDELTLFLRDQPWFCNI